MRKVRIFLKNAFPTVAVGVAGDAPVALTMTKLLKGDQGVPGVAGTTDYLKLVNVPPDLVHQPTLESAIAATTAAIAAGDTATATAARMHADSGDSATLAGANGHADAGDASTLAAAKGYTESGVTAAKAYASASDQVVVDQLTRHADDGDAATLAAAGQGIAVEEAAREAAVTRAISTAHAEAQAIADALAPVAHSGSYLDLKDKPSFAPHDVGTYSQPEIDGKNAATLASSKTYTDTTVASAVAGIVDGASSVLDTFREVQQQFAADENGVAALTTTVASKASQADLLAHEGRVDNPHAVTAHQVGTYTTAEVDAAITAAQAATTAGDASTIGTAKAYTDQQVAAEATARQSADTATLTSAKTYADLKVGTEATARIGGDTAARAYADNQDAALAASLDARMDTGDSATLASANRRMDTGDSATLASANSHTDTGDTNTVAIAKQYSDTGDAGTLTTAKAYSDTCVAAEANSRTASDAATLAAAKAYSDQVGGTSQGGYQAGDSNTLTAAEAYTDAKVAAVLPAVTAANVGATLGVDASGKWSINPFSGPITSWPAIV